LFSLKTEIGAEIVGSSQLVAVNGDKRLADELSALGVKA
jgi:hypothetical protein